MKNYLRDKLSRTASACLGVALTRSWILPALIAALNSLPAGRVTAQTFTTLHRFTGAPDTQFPSSLLKATNGFFYGLTQEGGTANGGTVFRMDSTGAVTVLHIFSYGANITSLIQASNGFFYGTAAQAGASGFGTIFRMDSAGAVTVLHSFSGTTDGGYPFSALLEASDGFFYGTAPSGGANRFGTVYRMDSSSAVTVLHSFSEADGTNPNASLIQASDGFFYGTAFLGGASGVGTIFRMNTTGTVTVLHHFLGSPGDGALPIKSLIQASNGDFYGMTYMGGVSDSGTIFRMDSSGTVTVLHSFNASTSGSSPYGPLLQAADGLFYGAAPSGGAYGFGTIFQMDSTGAVTVQHSFTGGVDGGTPVASLIQDETGGVYGVTAYGGTNGMGTVFRLIAAPPRQPPVARCQRVTVSADVSCSAEASIDDGSFSPNAGDTITLVQSPPGPYPLGDTSVTLTVTDNHGASNSCVATVTVVDTTPCLIALVQSLGLPSGTANSLIVKLQAAASALDRGNIQAACGSLGAFLNEVNAQEGKKLTAAQADLLKAEATRIRAVLGCP